MDDVTLSRLEQQVDALLHAHHSLKQNNLKLRNKQSELLAQQNKAKQTKKTVIDTITNIIKRLEQIEKENGNARA